VSETSYPRRRSVSTVGRMFARAALYEDRSPVDQATRDQILDRAIDLWEQGQLHAARALLYLATPNPAAAGRALDDLGMPPAPPSYDDLTGPGTSTGASSGRPADAAGGDGLGRLPVRPVAAQVLLYEDAQPGPGGRWLGVYAPVPVVWPPGMCQHEDTICPHCLLTWAIDHALAIFEHGPEGGQVGCRCDTCQPHNPHVPYDPQPYQPAPDEPTADGEPAPDAVAADGAQVATPGGSGKAEAPPDEPAPRSTRTGGSGGALRLVPRTGHHVHVDLYPRTGLAAVFYRRRPPRGLATGLHLPLLTAAIIAMEEARADEAGQPAPVGDGEHVSVSGVGGRGWV
jgi:hypothetical protein